VQWWAAAGPVDLLDAGNCHWQGSCPGHMHRLSDVLERNHACAVLVVCALKAAGLAATAGAPASHRLVLESCPMLGKKTVISRSPAVVHCCCFISRVVGSKVYYSHDDVHHTVASEAVCDAGVTNLPSDLHDPWVVWARKASSSFSAIRCSVCHLQVVG